MNSPWNENLIIFVMALVSTCSNSRIKISPSKINFGSKLSKFSVKLGFDVKLWKMLLLSVLTSFDLRSNLGLIRGILVILAKNGTSGALVPKHVAQCCSGCSRGSMERKRYFWTFRGPACKSRADKIQYQQ